MRLAVTLVFFLAVPGLALAQSDRSRSWEWSIAGIYQESEQSAGASGSSLNLNHEYGIGFNLGYNLSNNLTVGFDLDYLQPSYQAVLVDDTVSPADTININHKLTQWNSRFKGTYSFGGQALQPFIEAGGLGLRYAFPGGTFMKASYNVWELDNLGGTSGGSVTGARLEFGWNF